MNIRFYLFEKSPERQVDSACRLCRKILQQQHDARIWLHCSDVDVQKQLDDALWQFDASSFIAHGIEDWRVQVNISSDLPQRFDTLSQYTWIIFNFTDNAFDWQIPHYQVIEIVENDESKRQIGRGKFSTYKQYGLSPTVYKL